MDAAPPVQIEEGLEVQSNWFSVKNVLTTCCTSAALVVARSGLQKRNSSFSNPLWTYLTNTRIWLHCAISVDSSSCLLNRKGLLLILHKTWYRKSAAMSLILEWIVSFDKGTFSTCFLCWWPHISSTISRAQGFTKISSMVWGFLFLAIRFATLNGASSAGLCDKENLGQGIWGQEARSLLLKDLDTFLWIGWMDFPQVLSESNGVSCCHCTWFFHRGSTEAFVFHLSLSLFLNIY